MLSRKVIDWLLAERISTTCTDAQVSIRSHIQLSSIGTWKAQSVNCSIFIADALPTLCDFHGILGFSVIDELM